MNISVKRTLLFSAALLFLSVIWAQLKMTAAAGRKTTGKQHAVPTSGSADSTSLEGVIDFHCHTGPDVTARSINDLQLARLARDAGMRGIVLKNHYAITADRAALAMQEVSGIEVFGGIVLNGSVGGINAEAISLMVQFEGHRGKVVWLPTIDAENGFGHSPGARKFVPVVKGGKPVPELAGVFKIVALNDLVLETGHSTPEESLILIRAATLAGVKKIVVTHAMLLGASINVMKKMAAMGAVIECCWQPGGLAGAKTIGNPVSVAAYVRAIREIGAEHFLIDSDLGQKNNPLHPDGMRAFIAALRSGGLSPDEIDLVARQNPAKLLGLQPE